ncbi:MAG: FtsX-like permease family protein [Polyangiaceae bacterium]|jgi:putative ABC transport system permease protein
MNLATLAAKNLWRNRVRTGLTIAASAIAVLTFITLRTLVFSWTSASEVAAKDRVVTRHKVTFVMPLPKKYVDDVRAQKGIRVATFASWFGGKDPSHADEFFGTFGVDRDTYFDVYDEMLVGQAELTRFKEEKRGAIVGDLLAKKLGWKVGDKVTLESGIYPADPDSPWTFTIVGIYTATKKSIDRMSFIFRWDTLNDALPASGRDQIGWIVSRVDDPSHAADVGLTLDKAFDVQDTQTLSQDEASFNASFLAGISAVLRAVDIISAVILVIMTLVLGNTIAMGVRERTFEYGTLRAMGFRPGHVVFFVLAEAAFVGALGGIVGALLSYPLVERGLGRYLEENLGNLFVYVGVPRHVLVLALGLSVGLSVLAAILPARAAGNLRVTEALRRIA